jgi:hypothetical protein
MTYPHPYPHATCNRFYYAGSKSPKSPVIVELPTTRIPTCPTYLLAPHTPYSAPYEGARIKGVWR